MRLILAAFVRKRSEVKVSHTGATLELPLLLKDDSFSKTGTSCDTNRNDRDLASLLRRAFLHRVSLSAGSDSSPSAQGHPQRHQGTERPADGERRGQTRSVCHPTSLDKNGFRIGRAGGGVKFQMAQRCVCVHMCVFVRVCFLSSFMLNTGLLVSL